MVKYIWGEKKVKPNHGGFFRAGILRAMNMFVNCDSLKGGPVSGMH